MQPQFIINTDIVVKYLLMSSSALKGVAVIDICAATGLSKSTVYRVINKHPAIISMEMPGRKQLYYLDTERLSEHTRIAKADRKKRTIIIDEDNARAYENMSASRFLELLASMVKDEEGPEKINYVRYYGRFLSNAYFESLAIQDQKDSAKPETAQKARKAVDNLLAFSALLQIFLGRLTKHPAYKSDEEFWTLFIKDNL